MRFLALICTVLLYPSLFAQTSQELHTTCTTLAKLTETALQQNRTSDVVVYLRSAALVRRAIGNATACEAKYFTAVVQANYEVLSGATSVVSVDGIVPVKGWSHREVDELLQILEDAKPADVLRTLKTEKVKIDVDKLFNDVDAIREKYPEIFKGRDKAITLPSKDQ